MPLQEYFEVFYLQSFVRYEDPFWGLMWRMEDGPKIMGGLSKATQAEIRVAEAQGLAAQYTFMTGISYKIEMNEVIRRERDDSYFEVKGLPEKSPEPAESKFQLLPVELVTRESVARGGSP